MLTNQEALSALELADAAGQRSRHAYSYSIAAPYLFIWGVVWLAGYGGTALAPIYVNWMWAGVIVLGLAASMAIGRTRKDQGYALWRRLALFGVIYIFSAALFAIIWPLKGLQIAAYWPLLVGAIYAAAGLWIGLRFIILGAALIGAALGGYFFLPQHFMLWMALMGGGALILGGFWLKRA